MKKKRMTRARYLTFLMCIGASCTSIVAKDTAVTKDTECFNFAHVLRSLEYLENKSDEKLQSVANTEAMDHLKRHAEKTEYYPLAMSKLDLAKELLKGPYSKEVIERTKSLTDEIQRDRQGQEMCISEAIQYLPQGFEIKGKVFFTWGYDIGVAAEQNASLNLAHPKFQKDAKEIWFYCIHEVHHTGVINYHPMPVFSEIKDTEDFYRLLKYFTFLEGTAVFAAYRARHRSGALTADSDYIALDDSDTMTACEKAFFQILNEIKNSPKRPLKKEDWALLDKMSGGDRLWYRVGAMMARTIKKKYGLDTLRQIVKSGPDEYFDTYDKIRQP
ncbi:MAG: hypothetical protein GY847_31715 [Proteobacteria bacterium]|nr:hypothetical protein [Pseudomonadota bacterium]